jgi:ATP/maltotriose-dependent transcriptional regulator MalT
LHRAKLRPPAKAEHYVRRSRVLALFDEVVHAPLTLVVAPAGTGKTSLVAGWVEDSSLAAAWLSLDEMDRDRSQFWSGMIGALETLAPGCGERAGPMLRRQEGRVDAVDQLLVDLEAHVRPPAVLVVDDVHLVDDEPTVVESIAHFVHNAPSWLHIVLVSRREPNLPIDRMRSRGKLGEIRFTELKFAADEAEELLNRLAPELPEVPLREAVERSDGWAASLQLAALAARSGRAQVVALPADHADRLLVQDYVLHEVLAHEEPAVIEILSAAAVVPRINTSLAHALTLRADAGDLLGTAERRGLFVIRLGTGGWFELHALVREVLTADLESRSPSSLAELHARAARWFEDADELVIALEQWVLADRPREALRLLSASHGRLYDSGREDTVTRTIAAIPASVAASDLDAMADYAWCHLLVNRRRFVELVEQLLWSVERATPSDSLRVRAGVLQSAAAVVSGRWLESGDLDRRLMEDFGQSLRSDPVGRFASNGIARSVALSECWDLASDEVRQGDIAANWDPERRLAFDGIRAVGEALAGRPVDALRVAAGVRHAAEVTNMTILRAELAIAEAVSHRELGDRARAMAEFSAIAETADGPVQFYRVLALSELVRAHLDVGDLDRAMALFDEAAQLIEEQSFGVDVRGWSARAGVLIALRKGDTDDAWRWAAQVHDRFWDEISRARVHLARNDRTAAFDALERAMPGCVRHEVVLALVKARVVADRDEVTKLVTTAVELAAENSLLQTVASEGHEVIELIERAAARCPVAWLDRLRRLEADAGDRATSAVEVIEPLTDRERDVLRFLPSRLTVREIADELYVSVNTVKFHLRVIYRKLGVNSRAEAAGIARQLTNVRR